MKDVNILKNNGFDVDSVIETFGDMTMFDEILTDFYNESIERIPKLINFKDTNDMHNYAIIVHSMKGECQYLGINKLAELSLTHQLKSQENDLEYINTNFNELLNELNRILGVIKIYFGM